MMLQSMRPQMCLTLAPLALALLPLQDQVRASLAIDTNPLPLASTEQNLALETLNGFRTIHGLEAVTIDRRLLAASTLQTTSMAHSKVLSHHLSGIDCSDALKRAQSFGYSQSVAELIAQGVPTAPYAVVCFMDAPYHRRLLLKPGKLEFGCSVEEGFACMVIGGMAEQRIVLSPPQNAQGVPTTWDGREEPSPLRGMNLKGPFGYPVTLTAYGYNGVFGFQSAVMEDSNGKAVSCVVRHPGNDEFSSNGIIVVPLKPLSPHSTYSVTAKFGLDGGNQTQSWSFQTGDSPVVLTKSRRHKKS